MPRMAGLFERENLDFVRPKDSKCEQQGEQQGEQTGSFRKRKKKKEEEEERNDAVSFEQMQTLTV